MEQHEQIGAALFDRRAWRLHRDRAARAGSVDFLYAEVADRLLDRLELIDRPFAVALDLGSRTGELTRALAARPGTERIVAAEPSPAFLTRGTGLRVCADPEFVPFRDGSFDLAASVLALH